MTSDGNIEILKNEALREQDESHLAQLRLQLAIARASPTPNAELIAELFLALSL